MSKDTGSNKEKGSTVSSRLRGRSKEKALAEREAVTVSQAVKEKQAVIGKYW